MTVGPIIFLIWLCVEVSFAFYPLALFGIGNRIFRLATLGHEGLHKLISHNIHYNNFLARYFCYFPIFISFSRAKSLHMLHHRFLGEKRDPDLYLFAEFPLHFTKWGRRIIFDMLTLKIIYDFFAYYSELLQPRLVVLYRSDLVAYLCYWATIIGVLVYFGWGWEFLLYWILPIYFHLPLYCFKVDLPALYCLLGK